MFIFMNITRFSMLIVAVDLDGNATIIFLIT
jgi:hypothetical protein